MVNNITKSIFICLVFFQGSLSYSCNSMELLDLRKVDEGWICSASSSGNIYPCEDAFDNIWDTMWHPGSQGKHAILNLNVNADLVLNGIKIFQYDWGSGYAESVLVEMGKERIELKANKRREFVWNGKTEGKQLRGRRLSIQILSTQDLMGPIREVKLIGCAFNKKDDGDYVELTDDWYSEGNVSEFKSDSVTPSYIWVILGVSVGFAVLMIIVLLIKNRSEGELFGCDVFGGKGSNKNVRFRGSTSDMSVLSHRTSLSHGSRCSHASGLSRQSRQSARSARSERIASPTSPLVLLDDGTVRLDI